MKRRFLYMLLFGAPAFLASSIISVVLFGVAAGALWLFVLGDKPWPSPVNNVLAAMLILACIAMWVVLLSVAYVVGREQEAHAAFNARHVVVSAGATALLVLLVALHQWSVGNIGKKADSMLCSDFCRNKGFTSSGMPPRITGVTTCSCFDAQGRETAKTPMADVTAEQLK